MLLRNGTQNINQRSFGGIVKRICMEFKFCTSSSRDWRQFEFYISAKDIRTNGSKPKPKTENQIQKVN